MNSSAARWLEHPEAVEFNLIPLLTSLVVALGRFVRSAGWFIATSKRCRRDPLKAVLGGFHAVLKNKYYFDEVYDMRLFVKPAYWFAESLHFASGWIKA